MNMAASHFGRVNNIFAQNEVNLVLCVLIHYILLFGLFIFLSLMFYCVEV